MQTEKAMAPHSSTLAWKIPWMDKPGGLPSMGSRRVGHDWATSLSLFTFMHWGRKRKPTPVFLPGESQGRGAWWAAVYGVAQSRPRLKRLSSGSSSIRTQKNPTQQQKGMNHRYSTTWMNLKSIMLSKRSQTQGPTYCVIAFLWNSRKSKSIQMEIGAVFGRGGEWNWPQDTIRKFRR